MWTVDIDVGGTLTDGIFADGENIVCAKVDSTPHDLTVCLFDCLAQGARKLGFPDARTFLEHVELLRWSTTITSNVLAELRGPRIGLLISAGHETNLYGEQHSSPVFGRILSERDVIAVDNFLNKIDVMNSARSLLERGVRRICVSLKGAFQDPEAEISVKKTIDEQYPDHFLGSVPVLAGSDILKNADDMTRTHCALINAYTHGALAATLFKAEDELRDTYGYSRTFLVSHINGGVAGIAKTKAIDTIESGPILGIHASTYFAKVYGRDRVIALDVGGTTAKVGVLRNTEPIYSRPSDFFGIPVKLSLPCLRSIALGGGSVVKVSETAARPGLTLGPESMGSYPGPACYDLGGDKPTLTDAFVAAGLINPVYFLGGTKSIDLDVARRVIEESAARPLNLSLEEACRTIIDRAFESVATLIAHTASELREAIFGHALFAYGGNGGLVAGGVAEKAGLKEVYLFSLGSVFSAFGSLVSDVCHVYERSFPMAVRVDSKLDGLLQAIEEMKAEGCKDLLGEGIQPDAVASSVELEVSYGGRQTASVSCPASCLRSGGELYAWLAASVKSAAGAKCGEINLELIQLRVKKAIAKPALSPKPLRQTDVPKALKGKRRVAWGSSTGEATVYAWESLEPGSRVQGCAVLEGMNTTYFVPEGWVMGIDQYGNGMMRRQ